MANKKIGDFTERAAPNLEDKMLIEDQATAGEYYRVPYSAFGGGNVMTVEAYRSSAQSITQNTETDIIFDTENTDINSEYDNTTGEYTADGDKEVTVICRTRLIFPATNTRIVTIIKLDTGSGYNSIDFHDATEADTSGQGHSNYNTKRVRLSSGDKLKVTIEHSDSTARDVAAGSHTSWLQIIEHTSAAAPVTDGKIIYAVHVEASNTDGGAATSGSWEDRDLNTLRQDDTGQASLATQTLTIPAGTYECLFGGMCYQTDRFQVRLFDDTNSSVLASGGNGFAENSTVAPDWSEGTVKFTATTSIDIKLQTQVQTNKSVSGYGIAMGSQFTVTEEFYAYVWLRKVRTVSGTKEVHVSLDPDAFIPDTTNPPDRGIVQNRAFMGFDDTTDETAYSKAFRMPSGYGGGALTAVITYFMASATSGTAGFDVAVEAVTDGDTLDLDSASSFDTDNTDSETVPGTAGHVSQLTISLSNDDGVVAGDSVRLRINRDAAGDTATGDARVLWVSLVEA